LHFARVTFDLDKLAESIPGGGESMKKAIKRLIGEDLKTWFGTDGQRYVAVSGKDWTTAKSQLDAYLNGATTLAGESAFAATRKQLPAEASMLMLADAGKFAQAMADYFIAIFKAIP